MTQLRDSCFQPHQVEDNDTCLGSFTREFPHMIQLKNRIQVLCHDIVAVDVAVQCQMYGAVRTCNNNGCPSLSKDS